jgi:membrane associated rhomboid family serine protease
MSMSQPMTMALPKPGRALWAVMAVMAVLGVSTALLATWVPGGVAAFLWLVCERAHAFQQPWRLLTSGLLTDPEHWSHLLFSLAGLYFLGAGLERRWGTWRFVRFFVLSILVGNLTVLAVAALVPPDAQHRFRPDLMFGPTAAITAFAVAWSREFADSTINVFFVIPVKGRTLLWVTLGFCVLDLIYPAGIPEGVVAPFGGVIVGLVFGGSPSLARTAWLRLRLALLRRSASGLRVSDVLSARQERRPRSGGPPLRVVPGGLDEVLKKRNPPKDKRYLN